MITMAYSFDCPYLNKVKDGVILCECARITPPDKESRTEFLTKYCGHAKNYKECELYKMMDDYYKRKYSEGDAKWLG